MEDFPMQRFFAALLCGAWLSAAAAAPSVPAPSIAAKSWLLLDAGSGQIVAAQAPELRIEPASTTKIMTAYLTFAAIRSKELDLEQSVNVSTHAWKVDSSSSKMFLKPGSRVKVSELLHGLMVASGNDAAVALAEAVAGDEAAFVALMNRTAESMGLHGTHFANPHGLPNPAHYSTAQDLALLARRVIADFPEFYKFDSLKSYTYNNITQRNRNRLLWLDPSVDGMKTGYTDASGYSLIASAKRLNGGAEQRLIAVLAGAATEQARTDGSLKLLNWGFRNFEAVRVHAKGQVLAAPAVWKGDKPTVKLGLNEDLIVTLPKGAAGRLRTEIQQAGTLFAPLAGQSRVGTLTVTLDGQALRAQPLVTLEPVAPAGMLGRAWDTVRLWFN